jgi:5-methylcytosine-specific restriction endonuclease McrA
MDWPTARKAALARDEGLCRRCSREATEVHHRRLKQRGGTKDERVLYGLSNLISVCRECHSWIHLHPAESYSAGWMVHSWDSPDDIPVPEGRRYEF